MRAKKKKNVSKHFMTSNHKEPTIGTNTQMLGTETCKYNNNNMANQITCTYKNAGQSYAVITNNDVMRSNAELYLMAAKRMLKKVNGLEPSLSLTNLK